MKGVVQRLAERATGQAPTVRPGGMSLFEGRAPAAEASPSVDHGTPARPGDEWAVPAAADPKAASHAAPIERPRADAPPELRKAEPPHPLVEPPGEATPAAPVMTQTTFPSGVPKAAGADAPTPVGTTAATPDASAATGAPAAAGPTEGHRARATPPPEPEAVPRSADAPTAAKHGPEPAGPPAAVELPPRLLPDAGPAPQAPLRVEASGEAAPERGGSITIRIGRVEVRADRPAEQRKPPGRHRSAPDFMSLEDHLAGKDGDR